MESEKNRNILTEELPAAIKALSSSAITYKGDETNFQNLHKATPLKSLEVVNDSAPEILSINSYEYDEEEETSSSFLGASHPPEPIDIDLMQTLYVDINDTSARSPNIEEKTVLVSGLKPALGTKTILWDASQPPSGNVSPHSMINSYTNTKASESARTSSSDSSGLSDDSNYSNITINGNKPHKGNDPKWKAITAIRAKDGILGMSQFRLLRRLGCGDIGSVYLSELSGTNCFFAMKVMDKASLASRKKLARAQMERDILQTLDHPFLPTLYSHFETDRFLCLVMEYCPGGDLHTLRQRQPGKYFSEDVARFYAAEVLLALEYLHMLGIIYRDLKPENVLIRNDGHIMLSDFDLSLRCTVSPTLINCTSKESSRTFCIQPACMQPTCFFPKIFSKKKPKPISMLPELMAEPTTARSMSFVGTHEYLAPEIIKGEGHGSAVDWWTFGVFIHELLYGKTPFKGSGNRATLFNVVGQELKFPETPGTSCASKDLIRGLLVKEPRGRLGVKRGATEIKQHPFFEGVNWALIRCTKPPGVPKVVDGGMKVKIDGAGNGKRIVGAADVVKSGGEYLDFEFF